MSTTVDLDLRHVWHPFTQAKTAPPPIPIVKAEGVKLIAEDGREFLDMVSSWWVNLHGHGHTGIADAISKQAHEMEQVIFGGFTHAPAANLAARVAGHLPGDLNRVFYSDDGSTAIEVALKLAHQYWRNQGQIRSRYIAFEGGYHGDTVGAMSTGQSTGLFDAWKPMLFDVDCAPYPATWIDDPDCEKKERACLELFETLIKKHQYETAAVIIEPLAQGAAGMRMVRPSFLRAVVETARAAGLLVIFDEVMTGFGRTGEIFACNTADVTPDFVCLSKGLTGGFLPMAMTVCSDNIFDVFLGEELEKAFLHGHSFTANPLGCAAGLASLDITETDECRAQRQMIEDVNRERLAGLTKHARAARMRALGTLAAVDFEVGETGYGAEVVGKLKAFFLDRGIHLRPLGPTVYLIPPYCVSADQLHQTWDVIEEALEKI